MGCCTSRDGIINSNAPQKNQEKPENQEEHKAPISQAGGHEGSLIPRGDKLLKRAGAVEKQFYSFLFGSENQDSDLISLQKFVPHYYGIENIDGKDYLILENLLHDLNHPSILDCKVGKVTWSKDHNERKTADQKSKAEKTTTGTLGFRIEGLIAKDDKGTVIHNFSKKEGYFAVTAENIHKEFQKFVNNNKDQIKTFIDQTTEILNWFKNQRSKHFFCASILYVYDKSKSYTKFIDFAHVFDAENQPDTSNSYLDVIEGLENLILVWKRLLS